MARLLSHVLMLTTLVLLCHHASSLVSPTSTSTITFLSKHDNVTDRQALLSFKSMISGDPRGSLDSWNNSIHFCQWSGITCGFRRHPQRVIFLNMSSLGLAGFISPAIGNLTFLRKIDLSNNQFHGSIPQEIGRLSHLQLLILNFNSLEGGIPATLSSCSQLQAINMRNNKLQGEIPSNLGDCLFLEVIQLRNNSLTGFIPLSLANLSSLFRLDLSFNSLSGHIPPLLGNLVSLNFLFLDFNQLSGGIPPSLGKLSKLQYLYLSSNNLSGVIPPSLWNISSLYHLVVPFNYHLWGSLPSYIGEALPLLEMLYLSCNQFHGPIPMSLPNASRLEYIEISENRFTGTIPPNLGSLKNLLWVGLEDNHLEIKKPDGWSFLTSLTNCTRLEVLQLRWNNLSGMLPNSIGNLSTSLQKLLMGYSYISGNIPPAIGNLVNLTIFVIGSSMLTGSIPDSIGMLRNLHVLDLDRNKLSGEIPSTIGNLTQMDSLYLNGNELSGKIPSSLHNCKNLYMLCLQSNRLMGGIPKEILSMSSLSIYLGLASNLLTGLIPSEIGRLRNLGVIDIRMNKSSGKIPTTLGDCQLLEELYLGGNLLQGTIPFSLGSLRGIRKLDLSRNNLSGKIPDFLQDFRGLYSLNLSFNNFEGEVPRLGVFENVSAVSVLGNNDLCGGNPKMHLPACPLQTLNKKQTSHTLVVIIPIATSVLFLFMFFCSVAARRWVIKRRKHQDLTPIKEKHVKLSYAQLVRATNGFSEDNLIGTGSFGAVYKGILNDDGMKIVAVKVLNLQMRGAAKSFTAECEALRNVRHRNLVKVLTACSSVDHGGNDFKAMVFEFMANGNLDYWLHSRTNEEQQANKLSFIQRMNIAIDVASALEYLHHHGETPIIHCDLKPSNILLDDDMMAHLGDFGLARVMEKTIDNPSRYPTSSIGLKGTIGYVPPEYGMGNRISTLGDVYSYGILLLEMFTTKRPTDVMFNEGLSLKKYVESAFPDEVMSITDPHLFLGEDEEENEEALIMTNAKILELVASVLRIGIVCSSEAPAERTEMESISRELHTIRNMFLRHGNRQEQETSSTAQVRPEDPSADV